MHVYMYYYHHPCVSSCAYASYIVTDLNRYLKLSQQVWLKLITVHYNHLVVKMSSFTYYFYNHDNNYKRVNAVV